MAVHSITFTNTNKNGYLFEKAYKSVLRKGKTQEMYEAALKDRERHKKYGSDIYNYFFYERTDGLKNKLANKCLVNKTIEFSTNKINVIFGPNGSGKTTILKAIAGNALCCHDGNLDGFTNVTAYEPISFRGKKYNDFNYTLDDLYNQAIFNKVKNSVILNWDGNPVYYHNFDNIRKTGSFDDFAGTILGSIENNLIYHMNAGKMNSGLKALYIFDKLFNIAKSNITTESIIDEAENIIIPKCNDIWKSVYQIQIDYLKSKYNNTTTHQNTILLDEIENHLDVLTVAEIFTYYLPELKNINNQQIIIISHSPLVLSETICNPDTYNIISLDKKYTSNIKKLMKTITF